MSARVWNRVLLGLGLLLVCLTGVWLASDADECVVLYHSQRLIGHIPEGDTRSWGETVRFCVNSPVRLSIEAVEPNPAGKALFEVSQGDMGVGTVYNRRAWPNLPAHDLYLGPGEYTGVFSSMGEALTVTLSVNFQAMETPTPIPTPIRLFFPVVRR